MAIIIIVIEDFSCVESPYLAKESVFVSGKEIPFDLLEIGISSEWETSPISAEKRIFQRFKGSYVPFYSCIFQDLGVCLPLTHFEKEVLDHLCIPHSQLHPCTWGFVQVFQHWYEYHGKAGSASQDLFVNLFEVCPASKGGVGHMFVSLRRVQNSLFKVYINTWKNFKSNYFLTKPLTLLAHVELCVVPSTCDEWWQWF